MMRFVGAGVLLLWTLAGVAATIRGDSDALAAASLCAVVSIAVAFLLGRRSVGSVLRAKARASARASARAAARSGAQASSRVLIVNQQVRDGESVAAESVPSWQTGRSSRMEDVALQALRADELDAGDEYADVFEADRDRVQEGLV